MSKAHPVRAWYAGRTPPDDELIASVEEADDGGTVLYDHEAANSEGEYADVVRGLYDKMDTLKRNPLDFRTWTEEDGFETFLTVLFDFGPDDLRERVQILQKTGSFKFRQVDTPDDKKAKISAIFADPEEDDHKAGISSQARKLGATWMPKEGTLLHSIILQPAQVGRQLSDRLNPTNVAPFRLVGHPFEDVHSKILKPLAAAKTVAYERDSEIHLVTQVSPILANWDADSSVSGGCEIVTLLEALLLHELVELVIDETQPDLDPLISHIIASTFERYLKSTALGVAVEDFFLTWPTLSSAELEERRNSELAEQLAAASAFLGEEDAPEEDEEDLEDLPMDLPNRWRRKEDIEEESREEEAVRGQGRQEIQRGQGRQEEDRKKKKRPPE